MRFFKKTVFWFIILALIAGSFYLIDRRVEEKKVVEETKKRLFPFEPKDIVEFRIVRKNENILLIKEDNNWFMEVPLRASGDNETIEKLLEAVINAKFEATLFDTKSEEKLKEMGIGGPEELTVTFKASSGLVRTIVFGNRNPTMNLGFAILKDDQRIFRLTADIKAQTDKTVYDLRDKTVLAFEPLKIKNVAIEWADGRIIAIDHPSEGQWHITKPQAAVADAIKMTELLYKIKDAKIKAFADESPRDLSVYGLSTPRLKVSIVDEKGKRLELITGEKDRKQRGIFAKRGGTQNVFVLEEDFIVGIPNKGEELEETMLEPAKK